MMPANGPLPDAERYSEYSAKTGRSHKSMNHSQLGAPPPSPYHHSAFATNNFQL